MKTLKTIVIALLIMHLNLMVQAKSAIAHKEPCENFYEYACSNYSQQNPDPNYSEITQQLDYQINIKLLRLFDKEFRNRYYNRKTRKVNKKMFMYLDSCNIERQRNLRKYFNEIKPSNNLNWPLLGHNSQWLPADIKGNGSTEKESDSSENKFYSSESESYNSSSEEELYLDKNLIFWSLLGEIQSHGLNDVLVNHQIIRNKDDSLNIRLAPAPLDEGGSLPDNTILQVLLKALRIEDTEPIIQQLHNTDFKWQNLTQNYAVNNHSIETNLKLIDKHYTSRGLKLYFKNLLGSQFNKVSNITVENPEYFEYLNGKQWTNEELEHVCNYLMMKFLFYLAEDSTTEFTPLACIKDLRRKFDLAVNYYFYEHVFKREADHFENSLNNLRFKIKDTMAKYFEENYLNLTSRQINYLKTKLRYMPINSGNLPYDFNSKIVKQFYRGLTDLDKRNYYKNHLLLLKHRFRKSLYYAQTESHFIVTDNHMGAVSSPFYVLQQNMVVVPFGSFQSPLFNYTQTPIQQLSLFGFVLAHELTHAFDTTGLNYDKRGFPLSSPSDIMDHANFSNSLECMQHQQFTEDIDERIADLFAIRVVYRTYLENYAKENEADDWRKEFFLNLAQFFCGKDNLNFIDHDTDAVRLQQILMNFQPFSEAFGCIANSPMNPKTRCRLY
ncbi:neprilysin-like [Lucilia sericata]|uniref:neprilysin-like n=1 Tax=Lucilia sericata TaxID=13632 RepID=UPI0018A8354D|nr:neprilysin-like [Lucilia sericata]